MSQLALPLKLSDHARFDSYLAAGNESAVAHLAAAADAAGRDGGWIRGNPATGKSHLLQAVCDRAGDRSIYLPLELLSEAGPDMLDGLDSRAIVCIDDIDAVAGDADWELALFRLYNETTDAGGQLVVSASVGPREAGFALADLESRLSRLPVFQLKPLGDDDRLEALKLRAGHRGLELPDETARYLLTRSRRDMRSLYELLDRLDLEALRAQRRLTIPFVRGVLGQASAG